MDKIRRYSRALLFFGVLSFIPMGAAMTTTSQEPLHMSTAGFSVGYGSGRGYYGGRGWGRGYGRGGYYRNYGYRGYYGNPYYSYGYGYPGYYGGGGLVISI